MIKGDPQIFCCLCVGYINVVYFKRAGESKAFSAGEQHYLSLDVAD